VDVRISKSFFKGWKGRMMMFWKEFFCSGLELYIFFLAGTMPGWGEAVAVVTI
jgi:hypothetical protein